MNLQLHHYKIGALLYTPANSNTIVDSIVNEKIPTPFSLCLCLEDTIGDDFVVEAMDILCQSLAKIHESKNKFFLPQIYIRVRSPQQIPLLWSKLGETVHLVSGFVVPKVTPLNILSYVEKIINLPLSSEKLCYFMPILEDPSLFDLRNRTDFLYGVKETLAPISSQISCIRLGGNDLCHHFHLRRDPFTTIHEIPVISQLMGDVLTVLGGDYPVSSPVWEYYSGEHWLSGLKKEVERDLMYGFLGKTVIHPVQIPIVNQCYKVSITDYNDAISVLKWNNNSPTLVSGNTTQERMNEYKTHNNWSQHILHLSEVYGINSD